MSAQKGYRSLGPALVAALSIVLSLAGPTRVGESANRGPSSLVVTDCDDRHHNIA